MHTADVILAIGARFDDRVTNTISILSLCRIYPCRYRSSEHLKERGRRRADWWPVQAAEEMIGIKNRLSSREVTAAREDCGRK